MRQANRFIVQQLSVLAFGATVGSGLFAAEWTNNAAMAVGSVYSDNICLSHEDEENKVFATARPDIRLKAEGARASMDLLAALEFNSLADSSLDCNAQGTGNRISPAPQLRFAGDTILVEDWFYFNADAFIDQNKANAFGVGGSDNLDGRGNTNTTYRYSLSPYLSRRLSDTASILLRYTYDEQWNSESIVGDSTRNAAVLDIGTSPELTRWSVGLSGNYSKVEYDERRTGQGGAANNELSSARIRTAFQINRRWQLNGYAGQEWNDFISVFPDTEGTFWDVGVIWTPNARVSVSAGTGERFFGSTPRFSVSYRHKRNTMRASYQKDLTYDRGLRGSDQFSSDIDEFVEQTDPTSGESQAIAGTPTTITNSPILNERFTLVYSFKARRSTFNISAGHSKQTSAQFGRDSIFTNLGISFRRSLSRNLSFNTRATWNDREADEDRGGLLERDSDTWRVFLGLDRKLGVNTSLLLNYRYSQRNSEFVIDEYVENRISLTLRHQF